MQIWVTSPNNASGALALRLRRLWSARFPDTNHHARTANPYETHGELLTRIYQEIADHPDPHHVITEVDFIPYPTFLESALSLFRGGAPVGLASYVTRSPELELIRHYPLIGAWLILLNKERLIKPPPLDWLAAAGPYNDAANHALHSLLVAGCIEDEYDFTELLEYDSAPDALGLEYSGFGYHCFFARHFNDPPSTELFPGFTLKQHLEDINNRLTALGA